MRNWMVRLGRAAALCLVPAAFFYIRSQLFPLPAGHAAFGDPDYGYLLNSLLIVCGLTPAHIDHPGTLLQLLGALIIHLKFFWDQPVNTDIIGAVLAAPYDYLRLINEVMIAILAGAGLLFGCLLGRLGYSLIVAMIAQSAPLWLPDTWIYSAHVSPEILIPVFGYGVAYILLRIRCQGRCSGKEAAILGALLGGGLALKMNLLPLLLFLAVPRENRARLIALAAVPCAFVISTIPIWSRYGALLDWLSLISTHQANYGTGNVGWLPARELLASNLAYVFGENPAFFFLLLLIPLSVAAFRMKPSRDHGLLICCFTALSLLFVMVMKQVASRYLLPSVSVWAILVPLVLGRNRYPGRIYLSALTLLIIGASTYVGFHKMWLIRLSATRENTSFQDFFRASEPYRDCARIYGPPVPFVEFALQGGNIAAYNTFTGRLQGLYPGALFYEQYPGQFRSFGQEIPLEKVKALLAKKKCAVVIANTLLNEHHHTLLVGSSVIKLKEVPLPFELEPILIRGQLGLYQIVKFNPNWTENYGFGM